MTAVDVAEPTPEATAGVGSSTDLYDPVTGLTETEEQVIAKAQAEVFRVTMAAAARVLSTKRPAAEQRVTDAEQELRQAQEALEDPQAHADRLKGELAECRRRGEEIQLAHEDDSLTVRLEARSLKVAIADELAALEERLQAAVRVTDPLLVTQAAAEHELRTARGDLADLDRTIEFPFAYERGRHTAAHMIYQLRTGAWYGTSGPDARAIITEALRDTGMGAEIETRAIEAYVAGVPAALQAGGKVRHMPNGQTVTTTPGGLSVVIDNAATPQGLAAAPGVPRAPGPTGAEVLSGIRSGAGWPEPPPQAVTKSSQPQRRTRGMWGLDALYEWASR